MRLSSLRARVRLSAAAVRSAGRLASPCPAFDRHLILLLGSLLSAYGYSPNFPLTSLPEEYRDLVKTALLITYVVNAGIALYAPFAASARGLNPAFWVVKCFLFGGVALNELTSIAEKKKQQP